MQKINWKQNWTEINCLLPVYTVKGNETEIRISGQTAVHESYRLKTVLKHLAAVFFLDLNALRQKYGPLVNRNHSTPLPLSPELVLIPVKTRQPRFKDDGAWGYLVKNQIARWEKNEENTLILFRDGSKLTVLQQLKSVNQIFAQAEIIREHHTRHLLKAGWPAQYRESAVPPVPLWCPHFHRNGYD